MMEVAVRLPSLYALSMNSFCSFYANRPDIQATSEIQLVHQPWDG